LPPRRASYLGAGDVELVYELLEPVIGLRDRVAAERVRLDDVAAGREILIVNVGDDLGPRQVEQIEIAAHIAIVFRETVAPEVRLREPMALHYRPHRAIEEEDPFGEQRAQSYRGVRVH